MPLSNDLGNFSSQIIPKNTPTHKTFRRIITQFAWVGNNSSKVFIINLSFVMFYEMGPPEFEFLNLITSKILSKNFLPKKILISAVKFIFLISQIKISPEVFRLDDTTLMSFSLSRGRDFWFVLFSYCLSYIAHFTIHAQSDTVTREVKNREII